MANWTQYLKIYKMLPGRLLYTITQQREIASKIDSPRLNSLLKAAYVAANRAYDMSQAYRQKPSKANSSYATLDQQLSQWCRQCFDIAKSLAAAFQGQLMGMAAQKVIDQLFPKGLSEVVHKTYGDELAWIDRTLQKMDGDIFDEWGILPMHDMRERLEAIRTGFITPTPAKENITFAQVTGALNNANRYLQAVYCLCVGLYAMDDPPLLHQLIAPLENQCKLIANQRKRKHKNVDIDPTSGKEIESDFGEIADDSAAPGDASAEPAPLPAGDPNA